MADLCFTFIDNISAKCDCMLIGVMPEMFFFLQNIYFFRISVFQTELELYQNLLNI